MLELQGRQRVSHCQLESLSAPLRLASPRQGHGFRRLTLPLVRIKLIGRGLCGPRGSGAMFDCQCLASCKDLIPTLLNSRKRRCFSSLDFEVTLLDFIRFHAGSRVTFVAIPFLQGATLFAHGFIWIHFQEVTHDSMGSGVPWLIAWTCCLQRFHTKKPS